MRQFVSRLKLTAGMLVWDLVTAAATFFLLFVVASGIEGTLVKTAVILVGSLFIIIMLTVKYLMQYKRYGRDDITGGKNKKEFERTAKELLRGDGKYVLVYANIDRFKLINETYGNEVGDSILRQIQTIIDDELRWDEVSGRIMADNFGILLRFHSILKLEQRLYRISGQLDKLADANGNSYGITLYFGVYIIDGEETEVSKMLEHANFARKKISPSHLVSMGIYDEEDKQGEITGDENAQGVGAGRFCSLFTAEV